MMSIKKLKYCARLLFGNLPSALIQMKSFIGKIKLVNTIFDQINKENIY